MYFILDIPLVTSTKHAWFAASAAREAGFEDAYIWASAAGAPGFWARDAARGQFYLHVEGKPSQVHPSFPSHFTFLSNPKLS